MNPSRSIDPLATGEYHSHADYPFQTALHLPGIIIPQKARQHKGNKFVRCPTIEFTYNGQIGFRMENAFNANALQGLGEANTRAFMETYKPERISIAVNWPGYEPISAYAMPIHENQNGPFTMVKLVQRITRDITAWILNPRNPLPGEACPDWLMKRYHPKDLIIVELRHVAPSVWQPVLAWDPPN